MTKQERIALYNKATKKWGMQAQIDQMIEEMAELTVALNKYKRMTFYHEAKNKEKVFENLYVELSDVSICLEQMIYMFGEDNVEKTKNSQLKRFSDQVDN